MGALRAEGRAAHLLVLLAVCIPAYAQGDTCVSDGGSSSLTLPLTVPVTADERDGQVEQRVMAAAKEPWEKLRSPYRVSRGIWLIWNAQGISVGSIRRSGSKASALVRYEVQPVVRFSELAEPSRLPTPAPRLVDALPGETELCMSSEFPLELAELALREHMYHQDFDFTEGYTSRVSGVQLTMEGETPQVHIKLDGKISGTVTLAGVPEYRAAVEALVFPASLRVTFSDPKALPPKALTDLHDRIADQPFWKLRTDLEYTADKLATGIRQSLGPGFEVEITSVQLRDIRISKEAFTILARAQGKVRLAQPSPSK